MHYTVLDNHGLEAFNDTVNTRLRNRLKYISDIALYETRTNWNDLAPAHIGNIYQLKEGDTTRVTINTTKYKAGDWIIVVNDTEKNADGDVVDYETKAEANVMVRKLGSTDDPELPPVINTFYCDLQYAKKGTAENGTFYCDYQKGGADIVSADIKLGDTVVHSFGAGDKSTTFTLSISESNAGPYTLVVKDEDDQETVVGGVSVEFLDACSFNKTGTNVFTEVLCKDGEALFGFEFSNMMSTPIIKMPDSITQPTRILGGENVWNQDIDYTMSFSKSYSEAEKCYIYELIDPCAFDHYYFRTVS